MLNNQNSIQSQINPQIPQSVSQIPPISQADQTTIYQPVTEPEIMTQNPINTTSQAQISVQTQPQNVAPIIQNQNISAQTIPVDGQAQTEDDMNGLSEEFAELEGMIEQVQATPIPEDLKEKALAMVIRLKKLVKYGSFSREFEPVEKFISWLLKIPWNKYSDENLSIDNVKKMLDSTHFGLLEVKERILEYVAMLNLLNQKYLKAQQELLKAGATQDISNQNTDNEMSRLQGSSSHAPIICFVGVQGIGKTSIAKSIARAMNRVAIRISLGGLANVSELRGVSRGNYDAGPGQIVKALIRCGTMNPLIILDEIDKVSDSGGTRADVMAALLEILDPEQNSTFVDHYLDHPIDLSKVMFVCTANNLGGISAALLDRLEIVRMSSYTDEEKMRIAKDYLLPKVLGATGIEPQQLQFDDDVWDLIIRPLGFDAGIRQLERNLTTLSRKVAKSLVTGAGTGYRVTRQNFREFFPMDFGVYS